MPSIFFVALCLGFSISPGGQELRILPIPDSFGMLIDVDGFLVPYGGRAVHRASDRFGPRFTNPQSADCEKE